MTTLYIAMSLDGYIADPHGKVSWIEGDGSDRDAIGSYGRFIRGIDTIVMGRKTYDQIVKELSPHSWPYPNQHTYVITHHPLPTLPHISFTQDPINLLSNMKGKNVWICGGANLAGKLLESNLIQKLHISIIPILLGGGIPLFPSSEHSKRLHLLGVEHYNGITDLRYTFRR